MQSREGRTQADRTERPTEEPSWESVLFKTYKPFLRGTIPQQSASEDTGRFEASAAAGPPKIWQRG